MRHLVNRTAIHALSQNHRIRDKMLHAAEMHAHHVAPRAPPSRGELYRRKTLFLDDFPIFFFYPNGTWTHPPTSKLFLDFWNFFNFAKPLRGLVNIKKYIKIPKKFGYDTPHPPTPLSKKKIFRKISKVINHEYLYIRSKNKGIAAHL